MVPRLFQIGLPTSVPSIWFGLFLRSDGGASTAALGAITSLSSMALYFSYAIAMSSILFARYISSRGGPQLELGKWNLGRYGIYINCLALLFTVYIWILLPLPQTIPVTPQNMNYAGPIWIAVFLFALISWFLWARDSWDGPNSHIVNYIKHQE